MFWPHINADVKNMVESCDICKTFKPQQAKQPLQSHDIIDERWAKVAADLFQHAGNDYLSTVDYLTNFWEVDNLSHDTSTVAVINKLRQHFARYVAPIELVTDNGPQFASAQFEAFARHWGFQHIATSPFYPQSNRRVESAVNGMLGRQKWGFTLPKLASLGGCNGRIAATRGRSPSC